MEAKVAAIVCLSVICLGGLLFIVAFSTTGWIVVEIAGQKRELGLWRSCLSASGVKICGSSSDTPDWWKATAAMMCLAFVAYIVAIVANILILVRGSARVKLVAIIGSGCATLFILIAVMIFGIEGKDSSSNFNYSYALAVISGCFSLANAILVQMLIKYEN